MREPGRNKTRDLEAKQERSADRSGRVLMPLQLGQCCKPPMLLGMKPPRSLMVTCLERKSTAQQ